MVRTQQIREEEPISLAGPYTVEDVENLFYLWKLFSVEESLLLLDAIDPVMLGDRIDGASREVHHLRNTSENGPLCDEYLEVIEPLVRQWSFCFSSRYASAKLGGSVEATVDRDCSLIERSIESQTLVLIAMTSIIRQYSQPGSAFYVIATAT